MQTREEAEPGKQRFQPPSSRSFLSHSCPVFLFIFLHHSSLSSQLFQIDSDGIRIRLFDWGRTFWALGISF